MKGTGYIYHWRINESGGNIRVCGGQFAGLNVSFAENDCNAALRAILSQKNISRMRECPPPAGAVLVRFGLEVSEGDMVAIDIAPV